MLKRLARGILLSLLIGSLPVCLSAREKRFGYCQTQSLGVRVKTCTVEVFITGTLSHPTQIYQDNIGTLLGNPFTASSSTGLWFFYADNARYDVKFSGGTPTITPAYTLSDYLFLDIGSNLTFTAVALQSASANIAQAGFIRMATSDTINWRNAANTEDWKISIISAQGNQSEAFYFSNTADTGISQLIAGAFVQNGTVATVATAGALRLHGSDSIDWRNSANNGDIKIQTSGAGNGNYPADTLNPTGGFGANFFSANSSVTAASGLIRLQSIDTISWRNNANTGDITLNKDTSDALRLDHFPNVFSNRFTSASANPPALSGFMRIATDDTICWRNATNVSDQCLSKNSADALVWPNAVSINGDTVSGAARAAFTAFLPGNLTSTWTAGTWVLSKPINATSIRVQVKTAPVGCSPNAVIRIGDGVTNWDTTITAAANGGPSGQFWGLTTLTVSVLTAAAGCGTSPADANLIMEYRTN